MSLARGIYGIEYNPRPIDNDSHGLGWVIAVVAVAGVISLTWTIVARHRSSPDEPKLEAPSEEPAKVQVVPAVTNAPSGPPEPAFDVEASDLTRRPPEVRNLLLRLDEAERRRDVEMAVSTIETLRTLPGSPAADIDDRLARQLGALNLKRLFVLKSGQWVKSVIVRRGDSASRIAAENGSTLASLARLNGGNVDRLIVGKAVSVMDHPRFNLIIHRRSRTADLMLKGKFFKRYDLTAPVSGEAGRYELNAPMRAFLKSIGVQVSVNDRVELEILMPRGSSVLVSEM